MLGSVKAVGFQPINSYSDFDSDVDGVFESSFAMAYNDTFLHKIWRGSRNFWNGAIKSSNDVTLSIEEANDQYGVQDYLKFDKPVTEQQAQYKRAEAIKRMYLETENALALEKEGFLGFPKMLASTIAASFLDPVELAASLVPVVGQGKKVSVAFNILSKERTAFSNLVTKGLISETKVSNFFKGNKVLTRFGTGALEGSIGTAFIEPLSIAASAYEDREIRGTDSLSNIATGALLGSSIQSFVPIFKKLGNVLKGVSEDTKDQAIKSAVLEYLTEGKIDSPEKIYSVDERIIKQQLLDEKKAITDSNIKAVKKENLNNIRKEQLLYTNEERVDPDLGLGFLPKKEAEMIDRFGITQEQQRALDTLDEAIKINEDIAKNSIEYEGVRAELDKFNVKERVDSIKLLANCYLNI